jgi:AcrR family transcriptional regulator
MVRSDAAKNRAHLLVVARGMMKGSDRVPPFNDLAHEAGVGVGTVYRHFRDHGALLAGLVEAQLSDVEALTARVMAESEPVVALELLLRGAIALELDSPVLARVLASADGSAALAQLAALNAAGERVIARGKRTKVLRADVKPGDLRRLVCGIERAIRTGDEQAAAAERYVSFVLAGLRR